MSKDYRSRESGCAARFKKVRLLPSEKINGVIPHQFLLVRFSSVSVDRFFVRGNALLVVIRTRMSFSLAQFFLAWIEREQPSGHSKSSRDRDAPSSERKRVAAASLLPRRVARAARRGVCGRPLARAGAAVCARKRRRVSTRPSEPRTSAVTFASSPWRDPRGFRSGLRYLRKAFRGSILPYERIDRHQCTACSAQLSW